MKDDGKYTFEDSNWNNPNKTPEEKQELSYRAKLLNVRQKMPLDIKILFAQNRIRNVVGTYGAECCVVGFSGGKDSTVLSDIILKMGLKLDHCFYNTRLEYPECVAFVKKWCTENNINLITILPDIYPEQIWKDWGYPMFSKDIAEILEQLRFGQRVTSRKLDRMKQFLKYKRYRITARCCYLLKKQPTIKFFKQYGKIVNILGTTAEESRIRRLNWIRKGCIYKTRKQTICNPLIFFTEKDIWDYIKKYKLTVAPIYAMGIKRTGCYCCGFGCHMRDVNNFQILEKLYPHLYKNVMNRWGFAKICKQCKIDTHYPETKHL